MEELLQIYKWLSLFNFLLQRKDDKKNQLKYITKYMDINKIYKKIIRSWLKTAKEYDIPHLISEKKRYTIAWRWKCKDLGHWSLILLSISVSGIGFINTTSKKHTNPIWKNHK
jgi:hypothetical protein